MSLVPLRPNFVVDGWIVHRAMGMVIKLPLFSFHRSLFSVDARLLVGFPHRETFLRMVPLQHLYIKTLL